MTEAELKNIVQIAQQNIPSLAGRPDLEPQNSDVLDFVDVSVWSLKTALIAAYELGKSANHASGRWNRVEVDLGDNVKTHRFACSECNFLKNTLTGNYCPNCGAIMMEE